MEKSIEERIEKTRADLKRLKAAGTQTRIHQILERDGAYDMMRQIKHKLKKDTNPKVLRETPLKTYSQCMKRVSYQSAYVLTFEARMCRSLHTMAILEEQLTKTKDECKERIEILEATGKEEKDQETVVEMELLNELMHAENDKREMEDTYKDILKRQEEAQTKFEREAWGRSLTEFSVDDSSFTLPSITEEKTNEGRLSSLLDNTMAHPKSAFKAEDMSLGTAEMSTSQTEVSLLNDYMSEEEASTEEPARKDSNRHDDSERDSPESRQALGQSSFSSDESDEDIDYSDDSSSGSGVEFLSPEEADFHSPYPWRRFGKPSSKSFDDESEFSEKDRQMMHAVGKATAYVTDDESEYTEQASEAMRSERPEDESIAETAYTGYTNPDDMDASYASAEFQSPEEADVGVPFPWRRSSSQKKVEENRENRAGDESHVSIDTDEESIALEDLRGDRSGSENESDDHEDETDYDTADSQSRDSNNRSERSGLADSWQTKDSWQTRDTYTTMPEDMMDYANTILPRYEDDECSESEFSADSSSSGTISESEHYSQASGMMYSEHSERSDASSFAKLSIPPNNKPEPIEEGDEEDNDGEDSSRSVTEVGAMSRTKTETFSEAARTNPMTDSGMQDIPPDLMDAYNGSHSHDDPANLERNTVALESNEYSNSSQQDRSGRVTNQLNPADGDSSFLSGSSQKRMRDASPGSKGQERGNRELLKSSGFSQRFEEKYRQKSFSENGSSRNYDLPRTPSSRSRPVLSKNFSSQALLKEIENQSWCTTEMTKHALVDDEGWEVDRGQGRSQPLIEHLIAAFNDADSATSSRVSVSS